MKSNNRGLLVSCFFCSRSEERLFFFFFFFLGAPVLGFCGATVRFLFRRQSSDLTCEQIKQLVSSTLERPLLVFVYLILVEEVRPGMRKVPQLSQ